jgi:hypothetical protein
MGMVILATMQIRAHLNRRAADRYSTDVASG